MSYDKESGPRPVAAGQKGKGKKPHNNHNPRRKNPLPERCIRLAIALLQGPVKREDADRIAPASNSPHYIGVLRRRCGLEIPCEKEPFVTKDGKPSSYGIYRFTKADSEKMREVLSSMEAANDE